MVSTCNELYLECRRALRSAGIDECSFEARILVCHALGCTKEELLARNSMYVGEEAVERVRMLTERRLSGEPLAYITGTWEFYGLPMIVSPAVLIPRMDTEVLVQTAVNMLHGRKMNARILDLCCGSGCIACAIGKKLPAARLTLIDISPDALEIARKNIILNHLTSQAVCLESDALASPPMRLGTFDMLVCNPPYIESNEIETLDGSVRDWEPRSALDGGKDGLMFYRSVLKKWLSVLSDGGSVIFEVGEEQAVPVKELMLGAGLDHVGFVQDSAGTDRVVYGFK